MVLVNIPIVAIPFQHLYGFRRGYCLYVVTNHLFCLLDCVAISFLRLFRFVLWLNQGMFSFQGIGLLSPVKESNVKPRLGLRLLLARCILLDLLIPRGLSRGTSPGHRRHSQD